MNDEIVIQPRRPDSSTTRQPRTPAMIRAGAGRLAREVLVDVAALVGDIGAPAADRLAAAKFLLDIAMWDTTE